MIGYFGWVAIGLLAATAAARWQRNPTGLDADRRSRLMLAAAGGSILGAYLLQLPADLFGFSAPPPPGASGDALPLGGRTVLGGLLGGWFAVEFAKRALGIRQPTGDGFALPLAIALGCGRLGCLAAGCCAGERCEAAWWAATDAEGRSRVPVQAIEALFHGIAALTLAILVRRPRRRPGTLLAGYLTALALLRLLLEAWREHPPVLLGLTWYQLLAIALASVTGPTWWRRLRSP